MFHLQSTVPASAEEILESMWAALVITLRSKCRLSILRLLVRLVREEIPEQSQFLHSGCFKANVKESHELIKSWLDEIAVCSSSSHLLVTDVLFWDTQVPRSWNISGFQTISSLSPLKWTSILMSYYKCHDTTVFADHFNSAKSDEIWTCQYEQVLQMQREFKGVHFTYCTFSFMVTL